MDWDWVPIGIMLMLVGGFYLWSLYLAFNEGVKVGERLSKPTGEVSRRPLIYAGTIKEQAKRTCQECGRSPHYPDCPENKPKPRAERWQGFSSIRRALENQPEKENSNAS